MEIEIVISRYNEQINWIENLKFPYIIYNKGKEDINLPYITLPNFGRESGTYIYHIIQNYGTLPNYLVLLQGNPFDHCRDLYHKIENYNRDGITFLADALLPNDLYRVPQDHRDTLKLIVDKMNLHEYLKNYEIEQYNYPFGSQWIIPKNYIINKTLNFWQNLYEIHQEHYLSAWVMERMFLHIFNHKELDI